MLNRRGNASDIASLTLALLRTSGTPARYVRSVVEVTVDKVQNWLDAPTPEMALDLMQKGGIPSAGVIVAGRLSAIRFEHVWIEAYVDFIPSRGAINRVPDQWVPLDVAFKQFDYTPALPWREDSRQPRIAAIQQFIQPLQIDAAGGVRGFDFDRLDIDLKEIATDFTTNYTSANPNLTGEDLYDQRTVRPIDSLILEGSLPFPLRSTTIVRYSDLPSALRQVVRIRFYADQTSVNLDSPTQQADVPLVRIGTKRLSVDYEGASRQTDMKIICGTDFSVHANEAALTAATLAARLGETLTLVHVLDPSRYSNPSKDLMDHLRDNRQKKLDPLVERVKRRAARVEARVVEGTPATKLAELATATEARLLVVSANGQIAPTKWFVGSLADQAVQDSTIPVLVMRDPRALQEWAYDKRPLRVLVGYDYSASAEAALRWAASLRQIAPCENTVVYVRSAVKERTRLGIAPPMSPIYYPSGIKQFLASRQRPAPRSTPSSSRTAWSSA